MEKFTEQDPAAQIAAMWQEQTGTVQDGDVTAEQMAATWGVSLSTAQERLKKLTEGGKVQKHKRKRKGDGHLIVVWRVV